VSGNLAQGAKRVKEDMNKRHFGEGIMPSLTVLLLGKMILIEKYLLLDFMVDGYSLENYISYETPIFLLYKAGGIFALVSVAYFLKPRNRIRHMALLNFFLTIGVIVLSVYFQAFGKFPSVYSFMAVRDLMDVKESVMVLLKPIYFISLVDCLLLLALAKPLGGMIPKKRNIKIGFLYMFVGAFIVWAIPFQMESIAVKAGDLGWHFYHEDPVLMVKNSSAVSHFSSQAAKLMKSGKNLEVTESERSLVYKYFEEREMNCERDTSFKGVGSGKNLILIQVESLESQVLLRTVDGKEITPNLNKLISRSLFFPNIKEQVREGNSSDAEFMVNTSLYPVDEGVVFYRFYDRVYDDSLPNILKGRGYQSIAAHGDRETFWNRNVMYPQMGYDMFWGIEKFDQNDMVKMSSNIGLGLSDESFLKQCETNMETLKEPYMISLITLTSHSPFVIPDEVKKACFDGVENEAVRRYLESMAYVDGAIGDFVKALDDNGTLNRSLLVIYGDHEGLNKYYGNLEEEWENRGNLPLIICSEGLPAEIYESCGGQIDIMPTLMHLMGEETEGKKLMGRNLLGTHNNGEDSMDVSSEERLLSEIVIKSLTSMQVSKE